MMGRLFGTDGVRGIVGTELDALLALKIGAATARVLSKNNNHRLKFLVGTDTRASKDVLSNALIAGVLSENADVVDAGVIPTPAVSHLIKKYGLDGGFVVSASHNPSKYNGIKVFDENGMKLKDELEAEIEDAIYDNFELSREENTVGVCDYIESDKEDYVDFLLSTLSGVKINGLKIGVDTANGSAYETARMLFASLDVEVSIINDSPDGYNINDGAGSTHIDGLRRFVVDNRLDCGFAFDGDADRCLAVDAKGEIVDGDKILAICGKYLKDRDSLKGNAIVGTVMSNMGLAKFCKDEEIRFESTKVGDRYVLENMLENDYVLGGEESGHIIFRQYANTGDGELTALQVLKVMCETGKSLHELASCCEKYPSVLKNVEVSREGKESLSSNERIAKEIAKNEEMLGSDGRVLVRPSGTENLIRVMVEGRDIAEITDCCEAIAAVIEEEIGIK